MDINNVPSSSTIKQDNENNYKSYSIKKGIGFGAFGGFIAAVAFIGIILFLPIFLDLPVGTYLIALGEMVNGYDSNIDVSVTTGMTGFSLILFHGIIIGIIFGIVISGIKKLNPINKKKGVIEGLVTGFIYFILIGCPLIYSISNNIDNVLTSYPDSLLSTGELGNYNMNIHSMSIFLPITISIFLIGYLFYGFLLGGIITLAYSIYQFDLVKIREENKEIQK